MLEETVEFYQWLLDYPLSCVIKNEYIHIVFLGENETKLEIIADKNAKKIEAKGLTIGFAVPDLEKKIELLKSKNIPTSDITYVEGGKFVFFVDLNGCNIQLFQRLV